MRKRIAAALLAALLLCCASGSAAIKIPHQEATKAPAATKPAVETGIKIKAVEGKYAALKKGDKGDGVKKMQKRLSELGYPNVAADGVFGDKTAIAVYLFKVCNDLAVDANTYIATSSMQTYLYRFDAKRYVEPEFALIIPPTSYMHWDKKSYDELAVRLEVQNISAKRTVKAFELRFYALDVWGERVYGENQYFTATTKKSVKPGAKVTSADVTLAQRNATDRIYCAVNKIVYTDGTVVNAPQPLAYSYWEYK